MEESNEMSSRHRSFRRRNRWVWMTTLFFSFHASLFTPYASAELRNGMPADIVIGQPDFNSNTTNNGGLSARSVDLAGNKAVIAGGKLFVSERGNNRVKIHNRIPTKNFEEADIVLGQFNFVSNAVNPGGRSASTIDGVETVDSDGKRLFVADRDSTRILIWNEIPTSNFEPADLVLGESSFTTAVAGVSQVEIEQARGVFFDGQRVYGIDDQRVLIWNEIPTRNGAPADVVVGQPDFVTQTTGTTRRKHNEVRGVWSDGKILVTAEFGSSRVLIFNKVPTENFAPADIVLGQNDFISSTAGAGPNRMNQPRDVSSDGQMLFVADTSNNRVLVYKKIPTQSGMSPDFVIGQTDFFSTAAGTSRSALSGPTAVFFDGIRLVVTDTGNERILIYNIRDDQDADLGPQFSEGKAVLGKVFFDWNRNGIQDGPLKNTAGSSRFAREDFNRNGKQDG